MPSLMSFNGVDHSEDETKFGVWVPDILTDGSNYADIFGDDVTSARGVIKLATDAITGQVIRTVTMTPRVFYSAGTPIDPSVQKEVAAKFTYVDTVTGRFYEVSVGCPAFSVMNLNGNIIDMQAPLVAAWTLAVEQNAVSLAGNPINILKGRISGRK